MAVKEETISTSTVTVLAIAAAVVIWFKTRYNRWPWEPVVTTTSRRLSQGLRVPAIMAKGNGSQPRLGRTVMVPNTGSDSDLTFILP